MGSLVNIVSALVVCFAVSIGFASETVKGAKKDIEAFKSEMNVKLDKIEKQLAELKQKSKDSGEKAQERTVHELEETRDKVRAGLKDLSEDSHEGWEKFKKSLADSADELSAKIKKALKK